MPKTSFPKNQSGAVLTRLGAYLKARRALRFMTLQKVSKACGVTRANLSKIENGKGNPSFLTLLKVAPVLGITSLKLNRAVWLCDAGRKFGAAVKGGAK